MTRKSSKFFLSKFHYFENVQIIDDIKRIIEEEHVPVLTISKESDISPYRIYKWVGGKAKPKHDDVIKLQRWLDQRPTKKSRSHIVNDDVIHYGSTKSDTKSAASKKDVSDLEKRLNQVELQLKSSLDSVLQAQYAQLAHQKALAWYLAQIQAGKSEAALKAELQKINNKVAEYAGVVPAKGKKVNS